MAGTSAGRGKYSLGKVKGEILELKATQKRYAKRYLDVKSTSTADKISLLPITSKRLQTVQILKSRISN